MRLVDRDPHRGDAGKARKHLIGDRAGSGLDQAVAPAREGAGDGLDDARIGHRVDDFVADRRLGKVGRHLEIDDEALADLLLVRHDPVMGMNEKSGDEDRIAHECPRIAAATLSACAVSATSCTRMIAAPLSADSTCAAIEPPSRRSGGAGESLSMKRLREAPTSSGSPKDRSRPSQPIASMLCSGVLPKPMPGSSTIQSRAMPACPAIASDRAKNSSISAMMSGAGSTASRLCMTTTGMPFWAMIAAMSLSRCRPHTSLIMAA